jgi:hypothetical protein
VRHELFSIHFSLGKSEHFRFVEGKVKGINDRVNPGALPRNRARAPARDRSPFFEQEHDYEKEASGG